MLNTAMDASLSAVGVLKHKETASYAFDSRAPGDAKVEGATAAPAATAARGRG